MSESFSALPKEDLLGALANAGQIAYLWDSEHDRLEWSGDAAKALKIIAFADCLSGRHLRQLYREGGLDRRDSWIAQSTQNNVYAGIHRIGPLEDGVWVEERLTRIGETATGTARFMGVLRNVSEQRHKIEQLTYLAHFDELTGHLSRAHLRTVLAQRLAGAQENGHSICFGLIGLDNISGVNSAFGYDIADLVLVSIGSEIAKRIGPCDAIGRIGSSKFGVVFDNCPAADLSQRLTMIQSAIRDTVIETGAGPVAVTVSAAGVILPDHATTTHDAFAVAEDTLTQAKETGVDHVRIHSPDENAIAQRRDNIALADDLVAAVREDRLRLAYQPIVRADDSSQVAFHECLLRLIDRSGKLINAGAFMPVAERLGLVRMLDKRVLSMAFETLRATPRVRLSVNLSPQSLKDASWLTLFERLAEENPDVLERLILEVTEATAIDDAEGMAQTLNHLREYGCAVALDDFGAGYTSFQQFKTLQLDIVKIDGSYVRGVTNSPDDQMFVRTLSEMARNYELMVVAEMVENEVAGDLLRGLGVDCFQGFHFGMPEVEPEWLRSGNIDGIAAAG